MNFLNIHDSYLFHLATKAVISGDIFSANERGKDGFYGGSYNISLRDDIASRILIQDLI